jgi:ribonuclease VapC
MVVDASALIAIILTESEGERCQSTLAGAERPIMGAPSMFETLMVLTRWMNANADPALKKVLDAFEIEVVPFTEQHALIAYEAFSRYGKGRDPAGLNFGDCMAYAVAKVANAPLLFVGNDFTRTDISAP